MNLFVARGSSQFWSWPFEGHAFELHDALARDGLLERLREGHTQVPGLSALVDESMGSLESWRQRADGVLHLTGAEVRLETRDSALVLGWSQPRHSVELVARACLPLVEASLASAWTGAFPDDDRLRRALAHVTAWLAKQPSDLAAAGEFAASASAMATDGYSGFPEMTVQYSTVAAAQTVEWLVRLCDGQPGAAERLALDAARACEPSDTVEAQRRQRHAHGALLQSLL